MVTDLAGSALVTIFLILQLTSSYVTISPFADTRDWRNEIANVILGYRRDVYQWDNFAYAFCDRTEPESTKNCNLHLQQSRFIDPQLNCSTTLKSSGSIRHLPLRLYVINSSIIFPWIDEGVDHDILTVRLINMNENCKEHDWYQKVAKNSSYSIVPFSYSFDVFYKGKWTSDRKYEKYLKQSFDQNGDEIDSPVPFFDKIPKDELRAASLPGDILEQLLPVSTKHSSKGYFFTTKDSMKVRVLDPVGRLILKNPAPFGFWTTPELSSYGYNSILACNVDTHSGSYRVLSIDDNLSHGFDRLYQIEQGKELVQIFSLAHNTVIVIICDIEKENKRVAKLKTCYSKKLHADGKKSRLTYISEFFRENGTEFYLSFIKGQYCFNAVTYGDGGSVEYFQTQCMLMAQLEPVL
ncbi:hypothetical protein QAD02_005962 [Eretmocerus hayati]|uniref:Uncharacterized protein n=1 Tax=Eretmocerus hayati TaxID=131215 RepID=A0ACC2MZR7_9HYME|nr:hypothetical protein QAD02_005962 [Eretmocerus hayati]